MPNYDLQLKRTATAGLSIGNLNAPGSGMRRFWIWDTVFSSEAAPADAVFLYRGQRCTTAGTGGSTPTPSPRDAADAACVTTARMGDTGEPTYTANLILQEEAVNQRATYRWQVDPLMGLCVPATASNGFGWIAVSPSPASLVTVQVTFVE